MKHELELAVFWYMRIVQLRILLHVLLSLHPKPSRRWCINRETDPRGRQFGVWEIVLGRNRALYHNGISMHPRFFCSE